MAVDCIVWAVSTAAAVAVYILLLNVAPKSFHALNFRGSRIPANAGLIGVVAGAFACGWLWHKSDGGGSTLVETALMLVIAFGLLGLLDDLLGDRSTGGLRGHFMALIKRGRLTTGVVKAVGGVIAAAIAGILLHPHTLILAALAALVIALTANAINLTDTRPGRSLATCLAFGAIAAVVGMHALHYAVGIVFPPMMLVMAGLYLFDRSASVMMGDVGANAFGALIGLMWAVFTPLAAQACFLVILIWFHWWTESHSLSKAIEQSPFLRIIDSKIGARNKV
jgi:UDP-N-acetylmuramyl pentapeptide phosphotransferase/UDP-N-acetylglucosamine-1-phosphate transferase